MTDWQRNPNAGKFVLPPGYRDLGYQIHIGNNADKKKCHDLGHKLRGFDNSAFLYRCTDVITICDECKTIHHTDASD